MQEVSPKPDLLIHVNLSALALGDGNSMSCIVRANGGFGRRWPSENSLSRFTRRAFSVCVVDHPR